MSPGRLVIECCHGGDDEVERNHRDNLTGEASWDYLLKVEGDMMNVTYLYTQWVDEEFWSELDEDEDEETTTEEIRAYVDAQNSRLGDEGQDSPILYLGEQVIAWHDVSSALVTLTKRSLRAISMCNGR